MQGLLTGSLLPYKRSHLVALRPKKISASDPPSAWWRESDSYVLLGIDS
jgi:hypothetical protein